MIKSPIPVDYTKAKGEGQIRVAMFRWLLQHQVPVQDRSVVDLGAGACIFSRIAREYGATVTAIDGRQDRVPGEVADLGIRFEHKDVRHADLSEYDVVLILGLLYHLEVDDQLGLLQRCLGKTVLIDTQVCTPEVVAVIPQHAWQQRTVSRGEYMGVVFHENTNAMAAIGNSTSFWHTEDSYNRLYRNAGFSEVTAYRPMYCSKYGLRSFYRLA